MATLDEDKNTVVLDRTNSNDLDEWLMSAPAGNIRRLRGFPKIVAQADIKIAAESGADPSKKGTKLAAADLLDCLIAQACSREHRRTFRISLDPT